MTAVGLSGALSFALSLLLRGLLPDFWLGFAEGAALVGVTGGVVHLAVCLVKGRNVMTGRPARPSSR